MSNTPYPSGGISIQTLEEAFKTNFPAPPSRPTNLKPRTFKFHNGWWWYLSAGKKELPHKYYANTRCPHCKGRFTILLEGKTTDDLTLMKEKCGLKLICVNR